MAVIDRFVYKTGSISVTNGQAIVNGTGTAWSGKDRAGSHIVAFPATGAPIWVGTVAEIDPPLSYQNLQLPLVHPFSGATLTLAPYELVDGLAMANGASQAAIFARFNAFLQQSMGLVGNKADVIDYSLVPENSIFIDGPTRTLYQWRQGLLDVVKVIGDQWTPRGLYAGATAYALNDLVQTAAGFLYVSNHATNTGNTPPVSGPNAISNTHWTWVPLASVQSVLNELGVHKITISTLSPTGGQDGDLWFKVT